MCLTSVLVVNRLGSVCIVRSLALPKITVYTEPAIHAVLEVQATFLLGRLQGFGHYNVESVVWWNGNVKGGEVRLDCKSGLRCNSASFLLGECKYDLNFNECRCDFNIELNFDMQISTVDQQRNLNCPL